MRARRSLPVLILAAGFASASLAACGALSADEFAAEADALCDEGRRDFAEIQRKPPANAKQSARQTRALLRVAEERTGELRGLDAPAEVEGEWEDYLAARGRGIQTMRRGLRAARVGDRDGALAAQARAAKQAKARGKLARAAGLEVCGTPGAPEAIP